MAIDISSMSAAEIEDLISQATKRRFDLQPPVPEERPEGNVEAIIQPAWYVLPLDVGTLLQIRHPGIGWLSFVIPIEHRAMLLSLLLQQAILAKPNGDASASAAGTSAISGGAGVKLH